MYPSIRLPNTIDRIRQSQIRDYVLFASTKGLQLEFTRMKTQTGISMDEYLKMVEMNPDIKASRIGMVE